MSSPFGKLHFLQIGVGQCQLHTEEGGGGGLIPYKGLMGTCSQPGYVFRDFCLKKGINFTNFCLNQGIDFINFCLKQGIFSWLINSLLVCSTNILNRVSKIGILS